MALQPGTVNVEPLNPNYNMMNSAFYEFVTFDKGELQCLD